MTGTSSPRPPDTGVLDQLMPMHAVIGSDWRVRHAAPTLRKLAGGATLTGQPLDSVFDLGGGGSQGVDTMGRAAIPMQLRYGHRSRLRGVLVPLDPAGLEQGGGAIVNLSFAVSELEHLDRATLTVADFAPNDMIVDMLYLIEAKSAAMAEARKLIGRLRGAADTAEKLAVTDALTGLHNRRALEQAISRLIEKGVPFALTQIDLDFFKAVNDSRGHAAGDSVLRHVAATLRAVTRTQDIAARLGGDEFVILLHDVTETAPVDAIAERIIKGVQRPLNLGGHSCAVSTSLGSTLSIWYVRPDPERMLADADAALYQAKRAGRGQHHFWPGPDGITGAPPRGKGSEA